MSYLKQSLRTPQTEPLPGTVPNSAGGHSYSVDDWKRLQRFLILGSEGGSYYASELVLTRANAQATARCVAADGPRAVKEIIAISAGGRAPKNDPAIFALALAAAAEDDATRGMALASLSAVCRTGTHLFQFADYVQGLRGWGRGLRRAIGAWYEREDVDYQLIKYRQRNGWTHRDLLRLSHPQPNDSLAWAAGKSEAPLTGLLDAYERAQHTATPAATAALIRECPDLPREALQPDHLRSPVVWAALLEQVMPTTALIRNLATMTRIGLLVPTSASTEMVIEQLSNGERLRLSRVHPLAILVAMLTYHSGRSSRGSSTWTPVPAIVDALDRAFYESFGNVQATDQRILLALDVSGSMGFGEIAGMPGVTPRIASAAMALITAASEPRRPHILGFSHNLVPLQISPRQRLDDAIRAISGLAFGGTDCSLPMLWAMQNKAEIDLFVVYTDSETWAGREHPVQALREYRRLMGIDAKLAVVGMTANEFSIADPADPGMLDVVGFDTATPNVLAGFAQ